MDIVEKPARDYLNEGFRVESWGQIEAYFNELLERPIENLDGLRKWFKDLSELEAVISEDLAWRYIRMTCDTTKKEYQDAYSFFVTEIQPKVSPLTNKLNIKAVECPYIVELEKEVGYDIMVRGIRKELKIFREENIPLFTEIQQLSKDYGTITGAMTVEVDGKELTLQQAGVLLQSTDRAKREEVYHKISKRRAQDRNKLDELFDKLIALRHKVAQNAGFANFRDYKFESLGRFDYTVQDCLDFHSSVQSQVVPFLSEFAQERKVKLGLDVLRPWDKAVDITGKEALKPFSTTEELTDKTIACFAKLDPFLGKCLSTMKAMQHLDLDSRIGKAPGGYNYPLAETGIPFIFMNATSTLRDLVTLLHEGGNAVHSVVTKDLELGDFKSTPSEVAELASMSMELITMDHWDLFFDDPEELKRAKKEHLEQIIETLPWVATIDKFQHWLYENPSHTTEERVAEWNKILDDFKDKVTDWSGLQDNKDYVWQRQLHLYEVPFYYIEYGFAQLGAVAVWKNYKEDNRKGLEGYLNALKLGYTKSIPEIYKAANIEFNFSSDYIHTLMGFVKEELDKL